MSQHAFGAIMSSSSTDEQTHHGSDEMEALDEICQNNGINRKHIQREGVKIKELEMFFMGVKNLDTLSYFPNLTKLVIIGSELDGLTKIEFCYQLTELWLCETGLQTVPDLSDCPNIQRLLLYQNELKVLNNLEPLDKLQILNVSCNKLTSLRGLESNTELIELNLSGNQLTELGPQIIDLTKLKVLKLSGNQFESVVQLDRLRVIHLNEVELADKLYPLAPLCQLTNYRLQMIYTLQSLEVLNGEPVSREAVQEAIQIIRRKVVYYGMKHRIQKRAIYKFLKSIRKLSNSRLRVPKDAIKNLHGELHRMRELLKEEMKPIQKAAAAHKIGQVESRLTYWREFHRKLRREQRNAIGAIISKFQLNEQMVELELLSGGNIRFEEIDTDGSNENDYLTLCEKLVQDACSAARKTALGIEAIQITRLTRIYNNLRRNRFDRKMDELINMESNTTTGIEQSYVFIVCDPTNPGDVMSIIENNANFTTLATSPFDADLRFQKNYNSSFIPPTTHLILCRVYLGRCSPARGDLDKAKASDKIDSLYEETLNGRRFRVLNWDYILPQFVIELEFIPKPRAFPPLIFHVDLDTQATSQFTPRPTQEQEDKDYEVINSNPKTMSKTLGTIMASVENTITTLNLVSISLDNLPSLTRLSNLKTVNLSSNQITEVKSSWVCPKSLESVNLSHNIINKFAIASMEQLIELDLSWNLLHDLADIVHKLEGKTPNLQTLDLTCNLFIEDETQDDRLLTVKNYCHGRLDKLKTCQGVSIAASERLKFDLDESILIARGRTGDPDRCLRLLNSSQYLDQFNPPITCLGDITSLCLDGMGLTTIAPLEFIFELRYVSLCNNYITSLAPLQSAKNLRELHASMNRLKNVSDDLSKLKNITTVDVSKNAILELNLEEGMTAQLSLLDISCNQIKSCSFLANQQSLKQLFVADNQIQDSNEIIQLKNCSSLEILDIGANPYVERIDGDARLYILFHFPFLKALNGIPTEQKDIMSARELFGGRLTVDFLTERFGYENGKAQVDLSQIQELDLHECDLRSVHLDPDALCNLTSLNMVDNNLQNFSGIVHLKQLTTLCLNKNNIESVFPLTKHQRAQMHRSQYSQYSRAPSSDIDLWMDDSPILPKLEVLHLAFNKIKDMALLSLRRFPQLKSLFLESNEITKIDGLENCHEIRHLVLDRNRIKEIDAGSLIGQWRLEELHIDGNRLTSLANLRHLVNLKRLYIGLNRIQEISEISKLSPLQSLQEISMIGNGVARRMLHRNQPMLVWQCPTLDTIDGIKVELAERQNAEFYFMEKGHEPIFPQLETLPGNSQPRTTGDDYGHRTSNAPVPPSGHWNKTNAKFQPTHFRGGNYK